MTSPLLPASWQDALASVAAAYAAAAGISDAIEHLVSIPAPDFAGVRTKLDLLAEEFGGGDAGQLQSIADDLRRLAGIGGDTFDAAGGVRGFEAAGGGHVLRDGEALFVVPKTGDQGAVEHLAELDRNAEHRVSVVVLIRERDRNPHVEGEDA